MNDEFSAIDEMPRSHRPWVAIVGPTNSGKTTLANRLARHRHVFAIVEPRPPAELADLEPLNAASGAGFRLQKSITSLKYRATLSSPRDALLLFDRSLAEDREVFFKLHRYSLLDLTDQDLFELTNDCKGYEAALGPALCYIQLWAERKTLAARLQSTEAISWLRETLDEQLALYDEWIQKDTTPFIRISTDVFTADEVYNVCSILIDQLIVGQSVATSIQAALAAVHDRSRHAVRWRS